MRKLCFCHNRRRRRVLPAPMRSLSEKLSYISRAMIARVFHDEDRRQRTVCFTGHRHLSTRERAVLPAVMNQALEICYEQGYREFLSGGALGFDSLAAEAVLHLQQRHADVRLIMVIPCIDQTLRWRDEDIRRYEKLLYAADENRVLAEHYYEGCMMVRNHHMVDHSSLCLCFLKRFKGGTASTVAYALQENVRVLNIAMEDACAALKRQES